jgi:hypothetical protein
MKTSMEWCGGSDVDGSLFWGSYGIAEYREASGSWWFGLKFVLKLVKW